LSTFANPFFTTLRDAPLIIGTNAHATVVILSVFEIGCPVIMSIPKIASYQSFTSPKTGVKLTVTEEILASLEKSLTTRVESIE